VSDEIKTPRVSLWQKLHALYEGAAYRPQFAAGIVLLSIFAAMLEGIGLSFLIPVNKIAQGQTALGETSGIGQVFASAFAFAGVPFTLEWVIVGVALVMVARYTASFLVA
jgi:subfamily B ATP-binding cassette protein MsbA